MDVETPPVARDDAGAFLAPMLERVEAVIGEFGRVRMTENSEHAAIMFRVVLLHRRVKDMQQPKRRASKREIARGSAECAGQILTGVSIGKCSPSPRPLPLGEGESSAGLVQRLHRRSPSDTENRWRTAAVSLSQRERDSRVRESDTGMWRVRIASDL